MELNRVEQIYDEIYKMGIELEPDPTVLGPRYLNGVISTCRNYLNRVTAILLEIQREKRGVSRDLAAEEAAYQIATNQLLANDETIRHAPNIRDREARCNVMLSSQVERINTLKHAVLDLDTIEKAVKLRHLELNRTSDNIKVQRSLLIADRVSGAGYGDEFDGPRDSKGRALPVDDGLDETEIDRLMRESADEEEAKTKKPEPTPEPTPVVETKAAPVETKPAPVETKVEPVETKPAPVEAKPEPPPVAAEPEVVPSLDLTPVVEPAKVESAPVVDPIAQAMKEVESGEPVAVASTSTEEEDITRFLAVETKPATNGTAAKTEKKASKKKDEPKPQSNEVKSIPADEDTEFDFTDILKNI